MSTMTTYGVREIAKWCGVRPSAVTNWMTRYDEWPVPAVVIISGKMTYSGWTKRQKTDWLNFQVRIRQGSAR